MEILKNDTASADGSKSGLAGDLTVRLSVAEARALIAAASVYETEYTHLEVVEVPLAALIGMDLEEVVGDEVEEWYYDRAVYEKAAQDGTSAQEAFDAAPSATVPLYDALDYVGDLQSVPSFVGLFADGVRVSLGKGAIEEVSQ